jgi:nucleoside-diphosphate-sugar epimerase
LPLRILVLGGTGFIGRFVVSRLQDGGHEVVVFHRGRTPAELPRDVGSIAGDRHRLAAHKTDLREIAPEVVVDMIASSGAAARELVEVFRGVARRTVVVSSMDVYRATAVLHRIEPGPLEPVPLTETSRLRTTPQVYPPAQLQALQEVFGWLDEAYDKVAVEREAQAARELPATVLRLPMVYGPGDPLHRFFPLLKRILDGRPAIPLEERLARWRSPRGYAENVAASISLAATNERATGRTYNVGEAETFTELEWARLIADAMDWRGRIVSVPTERTPAHLVHAANLDQHWVADTSRIRIELGYREPVPRPEAIRRTVEWERAHPPAQWDPGQFDYAAEDAVAELS